MKSRQARARPSRSRLDLLLVARGLADSRQRAQAMILAGEVRVNGVKMEKAGAAVPFDAHLELSSRLQKYASRGGLKLEGALQDFSIDPSGRICLDLGSSTGGFTDCLLQHGAARVCAVDVNVHQLAWKLRQDPRVVSIQCNARALCPQDIPVRVDLVVVDVSFISVAKVLVPALSVAKPTADFLILVKPQFELRREQVGAGGIIKDPALHEQAIASVRHASESLGLEILAVRPSRVRGAEGNQEYFLHARKKPLE